MSVLRHTLVLLLVGLVACTGGHDESEPDEEDRAVGAPAAPRSPGVEPAPVAGQPGTGRAPRTHPPPPGAGDGTGEEEGDPVAGEPGEPPAPGSPARTPKPVAPMPQGIVQVASTRWTVTQSLVDRWTASHGQLGRVRDVGEGWAVNGVRSRAAWHLGMRNGDVIMEVNGHKLDTKIQLLSAYLDLKNDKSFDVVFYRDGARRVHHYQIVN